MRSRILVTTTLATLASLSVMFRAAPHEAAADPVPPMAVHWHADLAAALDAASASGRPVLLFQLLGRLDEALC